MKINTIAVGYERKFNLGDYNSLTLEVTCWADLEPGDDADERIFELQAKTREAVKAEYLRLRDKVKSGQSANSKSQIPAP